MIQPLRNALPLLLVGCATAQVQPTPSESTTSTPPPAPTAKATTAAPVAETAAAEQVATASEPVDKARAGTVYFSFDSADLLPEARKELTGIAETALKNGKVSAMLEGHADERGTEEYNLVLGQSRATSVRQYLERLGVPARRLNTRSWGEARPAVPGHDEAAWAQNRRVQAVPEGAAEGR